MHELHEFQTGGPGQLEHHQDGPGHAGTPVPHQETGTKTWQD